MTQPRDEPLSILPLPSAQAGPSPAVIAELEAALALAKTGRITSIAICYDDADQAGHCVQRYVLGRSPNDTALLVLSLEIARLRILQQHVQVR